MDERAAAFTPDQAAKVADMSQRRLSYWVHTGLLTPCYLDDGWLRVPYLLSFRDLVALRTLRILRETYKVPMKQLRAVNTFFRGHYEEPWSTLTLYVFNREVLFDEPTMRLRMSAARPGQLVLDVPLSRIVGEERERVRRFEERTPEEIGHLELRRGVLYVAGTRIRASVVWEYLDEGMDTPDILRSYPFLTAEDVEAARAKRPTKRKSA